MEAQLKKYLSSGFFNFGIEIHPTKEKPSNPNFGLLTIQEFNLVYEEPMNPIAEANLEQKPYKDWLAAYFNSYLLANYTNDELNLVSKKLIGKKIDTKFDVISLIRDISFKDQFKTLSGFLEYGTI